MFIKIFSYFSNGEPLKIHISKQCKEALTSLGGYVVHERGYVEMKGKGSVFTYWLIGATNKAIQRVERTSEVANFFQRIAEDNIEIRKRSPRLSAEVNNVKERLKK